MLNTKKINNNNNNTSIYFFFKRFYFNFLLFCLQLYYSFIPRPLIEKKETILDASAKYIEKQKSRFLSKFSLPIIDELSSNIDSVFYSKSDFQELILNTDNSLEKIWKSRILFESTPRGNIMMYYDAYKMGFAYSSDSTGIPYPILNAVAMKYVTVYRCFDFFMDNEVTPVEKPSKMIKVHFQEDKKESVKTAQNDVTSDTKIPKPLKIDNSAFAKFKNYSKKTDTPTNNENKKSDKGSEPKKEYVRNKFISLGKLINIEFTQPISTKKSCYSSLNGFHSKLLDNLNSETTLQKQVLSYKDFKKKQMENIDNI
jgi:hypothetical protein